MHDASALPTFEDVLAAAARLQGHAHRTPVLQSRTLNAQLRAQVFIKCENFHAWVPSSSGGASTPCLG